MSKTYCADRADVYNENSLPREFFCISPPQKGVLGVRTLLFLPLSDMLGLSRDKEVQL